MAEVLFKKPVYIDEILLKSEYKALLCALSAGLPDQGFEDSDNSSIFSSPSPKSRQRATAHCSSELMQNSSVQLQQRIATDDDESSAVMAVHRQPSNTPVVAKTVSPASDLTRPLSLVLPFPNDTSDGVIADTNNGQVLPNNTFSLDMFRVGFWSET